MIVLDLRCENGHRFEGWFASADAFREQERRGLVHCPHCGSESVGTLPSAPHLVRGAAEPPPPPAPGEKAATLLHRALAQIARQAENVGKRFPEEARRIHYDEAPARSIRGIATPDQTHELLDEGILVLPAPVPPDDEFH